MNLLTIDKLREQDYQVQGELQIKQYLPLAIKKLSIQNILESCVIEENEIKKIDFVLKEFAYQFTLVNQYSNLDCDVENMTEFYDELKEHGIIDFIIRQIPESEREFINSVLQKEIEQIQSVDNSIEMILTKALNKLVDKLPTSKEINKMIPKISKELTKISPATLDILKNINNK